VDARLAAGRGPGSTGAKRRSGRLAAGAGRVKRVEYARPTAARAASATRT
jgi:hypothetical protein